MSSNLVKVSEAEGLIGAAAMAINIIEPETDTQHEAKEGVNAALNELQTEILALRRVCE